MGPVQSPSQADFRTPSQSDFELLDAYLPNPYLNEQREIAQNHSSPANLLGKRAQQTLVPIGLPVPGLENFSLGSRCDQHTLALAGSSMLAWENVSSVSKRARHTLELPDSPVPASENVSLGNKRAIPNSEVRRTNLQQGLQKNILDQFNNPEKRNKWEKSPELDKNLFGSMAKIAQKHQNSEDFIEELQMHLLGLEIEFMGEESGGEDIAQVEKNLLGKLSILSLKVWVKSILKSLDCSENPIEPIEKQSSFISRPSSSKSQESTPKLVENYANSVGECSAVNNRTSDSCLISQRPDTVDLLGVDLLGSASLSNKPSFATKLQSMALPPPALMEKALRNTTLGSNRRYKETPQQSASTSQISPVTLDTFLPLAATPNAGLAVETHDLRNRFLGGENLENSMVLDAIVPPLSSPSNSLSGAHPDQFFAHAMQEADKHQKLNNIFAQSAEGLPTNSSVENLHDLSNKDAYWTTLLNGFKPADYF